MKFTFDKKIKEGYYSAMYFNKASEIARKHFQQQTCCMQFIHFNNNPIMICGIDESIQLLKSVLTKSELSKIKIYGARDGDLVAGKKPVLLIFGPYHIFAKYENVIDGILARRSSVTNNCYQMLRYISASQLIYMADRTDDYLIQPYDGYAAYIGGVRSFVTDASVKFLLDKKDVCVTGTIPHALIQQFAGNLTKTMQTYTSEYPKDKAIALVDYHNDIVKEIKLLSKSLKNLYAIRIDTSSNLLDKGLSKFKNNKLAYGVSWQLINLARKTLDTYGMEKTKIVVSSGVNIVKISNWKKHKAPIDFYGVGSNLITRNIHFTADLVMRNNRLEAKMGRKLFININKIKTLKRYT